MAVVSAGSAANSIHVALQPLPVVFKLKSLAELEPGKLELHGSIENKVHTAKKLAHVNKKHPNSCK